MVAKKSTRDVKLQLSVMKPIHARWLIALYDYLRNQSVLTKKGFEKADIDDAVELDLEREAPYADLLW